MMGVPVVLAARRTLRAEEAGLVAAHTSLAASFPEPMKTFRPFVPMVRWHHERKDGRGYPDGLAGDAIPLEAQIVGIANRFDEIQHDDDLPESDALARLRAEANDGAFDWELTSFFAAALD